jgi:hypothetical protein
MITGFLDTEDIVDKYWFTVTATNDFGSAHTDLHFSVLPDPPPDFKYSNVDNQLRAGEQVKLNPSCSKHCNDAIFTVTPDLPTALHLDSHTGVIQGAIGKGLNIAVKSYSITAKNKGGEKHTQITFSVSQLPENFTYGDVPDSFSEGEAVQLKPHLGVNIGPHLGAIFTVDPKLPEGLRLNPYTGEINGILVTGHDVLSTVATVFHVTVTNAGGTGQARLSFAVTPELPKGLSYDVPQMFHHDEKVTLKPHLVGGRLMHFSVVPPLHDNLKLNTSTGVIHGIFQVQPHSRQHTHVITATNVGGKAICEITLVAFTTTTTSTTTLPEAPASFHYREVPVQFEPGDKLTLMPDLTGDHVRFSVKPALPAGVKLDKRTGEIYGAFGKNESMNMRRFVVTAENGGGRTSCDIKFAVKKFDLDYPTAPEEFVQGYGVHLAPDFPVFSDVEFSVQPALPKGLRLDGKTGTISGEVDNKKMTKICTITVQVHMTGGVHQAHTTTTQITFKIVPPFPWWLVVGLIVACCLIVVLCYPRKSSRGGSYAPLAGSSELLVYSPMKNKLKNGVMSVQLDFDTPDGVRSLSAVGKPLGLKYREELPIKIQEESCGHAKELGIQEGWTLRAINNYDITGMSGEAEFKQVNKMLHDALIKLPQWSPGMLARAMQS